MSFKLSPYHFSSNVIIFASFVIAVEFLFPYNITSQPEKVEAQQADDMEHHLTELYDWEEKKGKFFPPGYRILGLLGHSFHGLTVFGYLIFPVRKKI